MLLFHRIEDAEAVVRVKGGVYKQVPIYRRGDRVYVAHGSGYVRVTAKFGDSWGTSNHNINVLDMPHDVPGLFHAGNGEPRWTGATTA